MIEKFVEFLADVRTSAAIAATTVGNSVGVAFDVLPDNLLTKVATVTGIMLSCVLIYTHLSRHFRESRRDKLEIKLLERQIEKGPD